MPDDTEKWTALSLNCIQSVQKRIIEDPHFSIACDLTNQQLLDLARIKSLICVGGDLSPYYRRSTQSDVLLQTKQILHLHLGGPGSNALLYLIQYPEHVLFLCVDSHVHLQDVPVGKKFSPASHQNAKKIIKAEVEAEAKKAHEATIQRTASIEALRAASQKHRAEDNKSDPDSHDA